MKEMGCRVWPSTRPVAVCGLSLGHTDLRPVRPRANSSQGLWPCAGLRPAWLSCCCPCSLGHTDLRPVRPRANSSQGLWPCAGLRPAWLSCCCPCSLGHTDLRPVHPRANSGQGRWPCAGLRPAWLSCCYSCHFGLLGCRATSFAPPRPDEAFWPAWLFPDTDNMGKKERPGLGPPFFRDLL